MSQATTEMMLQLGLEDKMAGTAFKEEEIYPPLQAAYDKVKYYLKNGLPIGIHVRKA